jgi:hypothetical protein
MIYKLYKTLGSNEPNAATTVGMDPQISFLFDPDNTDYQEYLRFLAEGNEPLPADGE